MRYFSEKKPLRASRCVLLTTSAKCGGFCSQSDKTKHFHIGTCCRSVKHVVFGRHNCYLVNRHVKIQAHLNVLYKSFYCRITQNENQIISIYLVLFYMFRKTYKRLLKYNIHVHMYTL